MDHKVIGHINQIYHFDDECGVAAKEANPSRRWYMDSGVVKCVRCTTSGDSSPLLSEVSYKISEDLSMVPYIKSYIGMNNE